MPALKHGGVFMNCDGIILDIDGTIWDTTFIVADAWNLAIEKNFPSVPRVNAGLLKTQFGKPMNVIADSLFTGLDEVQKKELMKRCCIEEEKAILANQKNITYDGVSETIKKLAEKYPVFRHHTQHRLYACSFTVINNFPVILRLVRTNRSCKCSLAAIMNHFKIQHIVFDSIVCIKILPPHY